MDINFARQLFRNVDIAPFEEREARLRAVSGYGVEKLIELFAAGYTLEPPKDRDLNALLSDMV